MNADRMMKEATGWRVNTYGSPSYEETAASTIVYHFCVSSFLPSTCRTAKHNVKKTTPQTCPHAQESLLL